MELFGGRRLGPRFPMARFHTGRQGGDRRGSPARLAPIGHGINLRAGRRREPLPDPPSHRPPWRAVGICGLMTVGIGVIMKRLCRARRGCLDRTGGGHGNGFTSADVGALLRSPCCGSGRMREVRMGDAPGLVVIAAPGDLHGGGGPHRRARGEGRPPGDTRYPAQRVVPRRQVVRSDDVYRGPRSVRGVDGPRGLYGHRGRIGQRHRAPLRRAPPLIATARMKTRRRTAASPPPRKAPRG